MVKLQSADRLVNGSTIPGIKNIFHEMRKVPLDQISIRSEIIIGTAVIGVLDSVNNQNRE